MSSQALRDMLCVHSPGLAAELGDSACGDLPDVLANKTELACLTQPVCRACRRAAATPLVCVHCGIARYCGVGCMTANARTHAAICAAECAYRHQLTEQLSSGVASSVPN